MDHHIDISLDNSNTSKGGNLDDLENELHAVFGSKSSDAGFNSNPPPLNGMEEITFDNNASSSSSSSYGGGGGVRFDNPKSPDVGSSAFSMPQFEDIPFASATAASSTKPSVEEDISSADIIKQKLKYLNALRKMEQKGVILSKRYTFDDDLDVMQAEFEAHSADTKAKQSIQMQTAFLKACVHGLEMVNKRWDPADLQLDGWAESVDENIEEYEDIFEEIHVAYLGDGMGPISRLLIKLAMSGTMVHMSNKYLRTAMPNMDQIMRENPEFVNSFQQAAAKTMQNNGHTGLGGLMQQAASVPPMGVNTLPSYANPTPSPPPSSSSAVEQALRPSMNGPSAAVEEMLRGLKTKEVSISNERDDTRSIEGETGPAVKKQRKSSSKKNSVDIDTISSDL